MSLLARLPSTRRPRDRSSREVTTLGTKRWRLQFSLKSLMVLVTLAAIFCSWLATGVYNARREQAAAERFLQKGGRLHVEPQRMLYPLWDSRRLFYAITKDKRWAPWLYMYWPDAGLSEEDSGHFCRSFPWIRDVEAGGTRIRDDDLVRMASMPLLLSTWRTRRSAEITSANSVAHVAPSLPGST